MVKFSEKLDKVIAKMKNSEPQDDITYLSDEHRRLPDILEPYVPLDMAVLTPNGPVNTYNVMTFPLEAFPWLRRVYAPSRDFLPLRSETPKSKVWVGFDLDYGSSRKYSFKEYIMTWYSALSEKQAFIANDPTRATWPWRALWIEICGYFPGTSDERDALIYAAARDYMDTLVELFERGCLTLSNERVLSVFS